MKKRLIAFLIAAIVPWGGAKGASVSLQAESFFASQDIALVQIRSYGGLLEGLDYPGEWVHYTLPVLPYGTYEVHMRCWGDTVPYVLNLVTYPVGIEEPQTIVFSFTGKGAACS